MVFGLVDRRSIAKSRGRGLDPPPRGFFLAGLGALGKPPMSIQRVVSYDQVRAGVKRQFFASKKQQQKENEQFGKSAEQEHQGDPLRLLPIRDPIRGSSVSSSRLKRDTNTTKILTQKFENPAEIHLEIPPAEISWLKTTRNSSSPTRSCRC